MMTKKYRLIVLGAGFSRPANFPLATELWTEIRETAANFPDNSRANKFNLDIHDYIEFRRDISGEKLIPESIDFEDFMRYLDIEHFLGLRGSDTWSEDGNEGTVVAKYLIGKILSRHTNAHRRVPQLYIDFARRLEPDDWIITFNYDTMLERALDEVGKPYRLFPNRFKNVYEFSVETDNSRREVVILKMHGSIDWFDRTGFNRRIKNDSDIGAPAPSDIIFTDEYNLGLEPIIDGPRQVTDPLENMYRAKNLENLYRKDLLFMATPKILSPSAAKIMYAKQLNDFWYGMGHSGYRNFGMAIVGYSLPDHDEYARQIMDSLTIKYQRYGWENSEFGMRKSPLCIVDFLRSEEAEQSFRNRFRFVDWSRADLVTTGFDHAALDKIFA
jgi:hypothetical protein